MSAKITALTALAAGNIDALDPFVLVDVSDTTMAPTGTDKQYLWGTLLTDLMAALGRVARLASDFTTTSTSLADVTGMSFSMEANATYEILVLGNYSNNNSTESMGLSINGSAAAANVQFTSILSSTTTTVSNFFTGAAYDEVTPTFGNGTNGTSRPFFLWALVTNGASASTLSLRAKTETGTANSSTIIAGAILSATRKA